MTLTPDQIAEFRQQRYNATVVHRDLLHSDLMVIRIKPDFPRPKYDGGQYCTLGLANFEPRAAGCQHEHLQPDDLLKLVRRSYSISSSVYSEGHTLRDQSKDDWLEFYIVLVRENPDGRVPALTPRLFTLEVGDRIAVGEKITGHFTLHAVKPTDDVVFLGTGTGEAPHNAMLNELLVRGHQGTITNACCVRYAKDLGYLETHYRLMKQFPQYKYLPLTTRESLSEGKMYIQDLITSGELAAHVAERGGKFSPETTHVFLCGNPKMIGIPFKDKESGTWKYPTPVGVIEILEGMGFKADNPQLKVEGNVHFEKYW
jgi:ferredoxin/flavodoxin---NADP+ reductase